MYANITGKPGVLTTYTAQPREIFWGNRQDTRYIPGPITVDGVSSSNPLNAPYTWLLYAGTLMGRETSAGKYRNSIIGLTGASITATATSITSDANTVAEVARLIVLAGSAVSLTIAGPPTSGGTVASETVSATAASGTTITLAAGTANSYVTQSLIQPADGSQTVITLVCDVWGVKIIDAVNTNRIDVYDPELWAGGGIINTGYIVNYPADTSLQAYVKAAIRKNIPGAEFQDDLLNI